MTLKNRKCTKSIKSGEAFKFQKITEVLDGRQKVLEKGYYHQSS